MVGLSQPTLEQRRRDGRLAWLIVGASATLTVVLIGVALFLLRGTFAEWAARQGRDMRSPPDITRRDGDGPGELGKGAPPSERSDEPLPIAQGPAPPDDARPIGRAGDWIGTDDYPPTALRMGYEGRVRVTVAVDQAGRPTGCAVRRSSGHWSLDNATCAAMINRGRFDIARDGPRVRHWTSPVIRWVLPAEQSAHRTVAKKGG